LIPRLAKTYGAGFVPSFGVLLPKMVGYTSPDKDINDNIQIVGCFAQCFKNCPALVQSYGKSILPTLLEMSQTH
jgi:hypothetical protein